MIVKQQQTHQTRIKKSFQRKLYDIERVKLDIESYTFITSKIRYELTKIRVN